MAKKAFNFIKRLFCSHEYAELWDGRIKYMDGAELGFIICVCIKCGKVD